VRPFIGICNTLSYSKWWKTTERNKWETQNGNLESVHFQWFHKERPYDTLNDEPVQDRIQQFFRMFKDHELSVSKNKPSALVYTKFKGILVTFITRLWQSTRVKIVGCKYKTLLDLRKSYIFLVQVMLKAWRMLNDSSTLSYF
jgi:hypothetical protein